MSLTSSRPHVKYTQKICKIAFVCVVCDVGVGVGVGVGLGVGLVLVVGLVSKEVEVTRK